LSQKGKYLNIGNGIDIFFRDDGKAEYLSTVRTSPEAVEHQVYEWQSKHSEDERFEFSERWVQQFDLAEISDANDLASALNLNDQQSRQLVHAFRSVKTLAMSVGAPTKEAEMVAREMLKGLIKKQQSTKPSSSL